MSVFELIDTCEIRRRKSTEDYGGTGADEYYTYATEVPCLLIEDPGKIVVKQDFGRDISCDAIVRLEESLQATDLLVVNGYKYEPVTVLPVRDRITNQIRYYRAPLKRVAETSDAIEQQEPVIK